MNLSFSKFNELLKNTGEKDLPETPQTDRDLSQQVESPTTKELKTSLKEQPVPEESTTQSAPNIPSVGKVNELEEVKKKLKGGRSKSILSSPNWSKWDKIKIGMDAGDRRAWRNMQRSLKGPEFQELLDTAAEQDISPARLVNMAHEHTKSLMNNIDSEYPEEKKRTPEQNIEYAKRKTKYGRILGQTSRADPLASVDTHFRFNPQQTENDYLTYAAHHVGGMFGKKHRPDLYNIIHATRKFSPEHSTDAILRHIQDKTGYEPTEEDKNHIIKLFAILGKHAGSRRPAMAEPGIPDIKTYKQRRRGAGPILKQRVATTSGVVGPDQEYGLFGKYQVPTEIQKNIRERMIGKQGLQTRQQELKETKKFDVSEKRKDVESSKLGNKLAKRKAIEDKALQDIISTTPPELINQEKVKLFSNSRKELINGLGKVLSSHPKGSEIAQRLESFRNDPKLVGMYRTKGTVPPDFADILQINEDKEAGGPKDLIAGYFQNLLNNDDELRQLGVEPGTWTFLGNKGIKRPSISNKRTGRRVTKELEEPSVEKLASMSPIEIIRYKKSLLISKKTETVGDFIEEFTKAFEPSSERIKKKIFKSTLRNMIKEKLGLE